MRNQAGQIDGRFNAGVASADDRHALALVQRAVAVRAIRHAVITVLALARHVDFTPTRTRRQNNRLAFKHAAISQLDRSEEHTSELQSLMRISYAVFCLKKKNTKIRT